MVCYYVERLSKPVQSTITVHGVLLLDLRHLCSSLFPKTSVNFLSDFGLISNIIVYIYKIKLPKSMTIPKAKTAAIIQDISVYDVFVLTWLLLEN